MPAKSAAIWIPDVAGFIAAVTLGYVLYVFDGWHELFRDSDTGWHIRCGEAMLSTRHLPRTDPYSFSRSGATWMDWEWGSDVLAGAAHRLGGLAAVALLFAIAIALCSWLWFHFTWSAGGDFLLACALALPMLSTVNMHWLARPHIFGWVLLVTWMWWIESRGGRVNRRDIVAALLFGSVWANLHASFFLAPIIALLYAAGHALDSVIFGAAKPVRGYLLAALTFLVGALVNPYGIALYRHVFGYLLDSELLSRVGEFQSFNFHTAGSAWILISVGIAALGSVLALQNRRIEHFIVGAFFIAVALRSARGLPLVALCVLPLANANIAAALRHANGLAPWLRTRIDAALAYSGRLRVLDAGVAGWATLPLVLVLFIFAAKSAQAGFPPNQFPVAAAAEIAKLPDNARLLAPDKFGGYLIYRFAGARKVFFDGRSDFYGAAFMKQYLRLMEARPGWREIASQYRFTHALLPAGAPLAAALTEAGWRRVYKDGTAVLFAAPK